MDSFSELERLRQRGDGHMEAGSASEREALARFTDFFSHLSVEAVKNKVRDTYAEDVYFNDTLKTVRGLDNLVDYLHDSAEAAEDVRVEIMDATRTQAGDYLVRWKMMIRFKKFAKGRDTWSIGMSHLRFDGDGRVAYQQDYWDSASGLFEHVPLLGHGIRAIKGRL